MAVRAVKTTPPSVPSDETRAPAGFGATYLETLRALGTASRAVPLLALTATVLVAEASIARDPAAVALDALLALSFVLTAPAAWRALFGGDTSRRGAAHSWLATLGYLLIVAVVVGLVGYVLPFVLDVRTYVTDPSGVGLLVALFGVGGWGLGRDIEMERGLVEERRRRERLAVEAEHAQLLAMKAQLDPHFLFNTLNAIAEWCQDDPAVAEAATLRLADLLRAVLEGIEAERWPLAREIEIAESLFAMYALRDAERFQLTLHTPEPLPTLDIPPLLLLPLFENAIAHGPAKGHRGPVTVTLEQDGDEVRVEVRNPGPYGGPRAGGHGLPTLERRLTLAFGEDARFVIEGAGGETAAGQTIATVTISAHGEPRG